MRNRFVLLLDLLLVAFCAFCAFALRLDLIAERARRGAEAGDVVQAEPYLVSNTDLQDFRMIVTSANPHGGKIALDDAELHLLRCHHGDTVRTLSLNPRKHPHV